MMLRRFEGDSSIIENIASQWRSLNDEGPCCEPFFRPEWIAAHAKAFTPNVKLLLITAWDEARLRGVLPLLQESATISGVAIKKLRGVNNAHTGRFDLIHGAGDKEEVAKKIWQDLRDSSDWDLIELQDVPNDGAFGYIVKHAEIDRFPCAKVDSLKSPFLEVSPENNSAKTPKSYEQFRSRLKNKKKKVEKQLGPVSLIRITDANPAILHEFFDMEGSGWKGKEGTAIKCHPETLQFYNELAANAAYFGKLSMSVLKAGNQSIAMHFAQIYAGCYFAQKVTYAEQHATFSPGQLLVNEVIKNAKEIGINKYDFLGDSSEWKSVWTDQVRAHTSHYIFRRNFRGYLLCLINFRIRRVLGKIRRLMKSRLEKR